MLSYKFKVTSNPSEYFFEIKGLDEALRVHFKTNFILLKIINSPVPIGDLKQLLGTND